LSFFDRTLRRLAQVGDASLRVAGSTAGDCTGAPTRTLSFSNPAASVRTDHVRTQRFRQRRPDLFRERRSGLRTAGQPVEPVRKSAKKRFQRVAHC
jgi:uncharacterized protein with von Willebrand factor type A (vWA) domain